MAVTKYNYKNVSIRLKLFINMALAVILLASNFLLFFRFHYQINQLNAETRQVEKITPKLIETLYIKTQFEKSISRTDSQRVVDNIDSLEKNIYTLKRSFMKNKLSTKELIEIDNYVKDFRKSVNMAIETRTQEKNYDESMQETLRILLELIDSAKNSVSSKLVTKESESKINNAEVTAYEYLTKLTVILINTDMNSEQKLVEQLNISNNLVEPMVTLNLRDKGLQISTYSEQLYSKWKVLRTARNFESSTDADISSIIDKIDINVGITVNSISQTLKEKEDTTSFSIIVLSICSTMIVLLLTFFSVKRISRKFEVLIGATKQIADGDFSVNFSPKEGDEIDLLGKHIYHMSESLKSYQKSLLETNENLRISNICLEDAVSQRTRQLEETRDKLLIVNEELEKDKKKFQLLASTDSLTGIWNRGAIMNLVKDEINQYDNYQKLFCVVLFDIDDFKKVNDQHGHNIGDEVLIEITKLVKNTIFNEGYLGRYGGEEFLILIPNTTLETAKILLENVFVKLRTTPLSSKLLPIRISAGLVEYKNCKIDELLQKVDELLYQSKKNGKDQFSY